jgi:pyruvate-ferredoxin/flavodoxin oxidoreductase
MGELADEWSFRGRTNLWGAVPEVVEMQSEAGAAGTVHGALQGGALATTFTASQGLLLMIPAMYRIAGELLPFVMHVAARAVATHALSIFGDHSDVMACRQTGFALLASGSVQEAQDLAAVAHAATLASRIPFLHFFDGFRTSHELATIAPLADDDLRALIDDGDVAAHRARALTPDRPVVRGTAQNPDAFFQAREAANPFHAASPDAVQAAMDRLAERTGRRYRLFDWVGHPEAERVIVCMGSAAETVHETVEALAARGERVGLVKVRLYRPFSAAHFLAALPRTTRAIGVLDRTKEPGAPGEPLWLDVVATLREAEQAGAAPFPAPPVVVGGRYGLSSKELTPPMVRAVLAELTAPHPTRHFTLGIVDDVSGTSLPFDPAPEPEPDDRFCAVFYGLGSDGTVGANKSSAKILGDGEDRHVQAYFVYDSKKAGAVTVSHLRFGPRPIRSAYLVGRASFVACHQWSFLERRDVLSCAAPGATFLLNAPHPPDRVWDRLPYEVQAAICEKRLRCWVIDAARVAREAGLGGRINTVMQACFFAVSGVQPLDAALGAVRRAIEKTYGRLGPQVVERNLAALDRTLAELHRFEVPDRPTATARRPPAVPREAPDFVRRVTAALMAGEGDRLPVSAFPPDGTWPVGTARWEKRNLADAIPVWDPALCIQCNKCALVCPHAAIRAKAYPPAALAGAPEGFLAVDWKGVDLPGTKYTIQVAPEDCTGCTLCAVVCPAKDKANPRHKALDMSPQAPRREAERARFAFFERLPDPDRTAVRISDVKGSQLLPPLFEFSGACAGCGETPYVKLLTQLFGDRALIANATGCSSIYGGNLPTTPYTTDRAGRGPAWANSLFEDDAEFGLGLRLAADRHLAEARALVRTLAPALGDALVAALLETEQRTERGIAAVRDAVVAARARVAGLDGSDARRLALLADWLVEKSVWIVGGDGWAYDIGFGGLDHVLASGRNVNALVLDTEVYSNTGGQQSKATPLAAAAKFAAAGKALPKKDLGLMMMSYGHVYVASVAMGARDAQTVRAFEEAEAYPGPSLVIAYSHCIAHGYDLAHGLGQQRAAVDSGHWPLYRFDPRRTATGEPPLALDAPAPRQPLVDYLRGEARFRMVERQDPSRFKALVAAAERAIAARNAIYRRLAAPDGTAA